MKIVQSCPICTSTDQRFAFTAPTTRGLDRKLWTVSECSDCGHQFMNPQPSWEELKFYYDNGYSVYSPEHDSEFGDAEVIRTAKETGFFRHIPLLTGKRILDVGCGARFFLRIAKKLGAIEQGVEPSEYPASVAQKQSLNVFCGTLEDFAIQSDVKFDIITSNHVIEHVSRPVETLAAIKEIVAPGGFIWIAYPNAVYPLTKALNGRWHSTDLPYHLMQFSPASIARAGAEAGLKVKCQTTESVPRFVEHSLSQYFRHKWMLLWWSHGC